MKIALTAWEDRISPVFDAATTLLLVELADGCIREKRLLPLPPVGAMRLAEMLKQMGISVLICGAISEGHANRLSFNGIRLIPFVSGKSEHILDAFAKGEPLTPAFSMPGCATHCRNRKSESAQPLNRREVTKMPGKNRSGPSGQKPDTDKGSGGGAGSYSGQGQGRCKAGPGAGKGKNPGRGRGRKGGSGQGQCQSE